MARIPNRLVSIILPCHNAAAFLGAALESVLAQTYRELEVVAIDDGSDDATGEILRKVAARDDRLRVLANEQQLGVIKSLKRAVAESNGEFIARMDADDLIDAQRIERQLDALALRPDVGVVGSSIMVIDEAGRVIGRRRVRCTSPAAAPFLALFGIPVMHATIMARSEVMRRFPYRDAPECLHTEDYDLFTRMLGEGVQMLSVDLPLYRMRSHAASVSHRFEPVQIANFVGLARAHLERTFDIRLSSGSHRVLVNRMDSATTVAELRCGLHWLDRLRDTFLQDAVRGDAVARAEVVAIADQQRIDILGQATLKGPARRRLGGAALVARHARSFASPPSRRYLRDKVWGRVISSRG